MPLGRFLGHLGVPWVDFGGFELNRVGCGTELVSILEPKMVPKRHPKRTKIEDKNEDEKKSLSKPVLELSGSHLGPILDDSDRQNRAVAPVALDFLKNHVFQQMRRQEAIWSRTWVGLRGQEAPKWRPRRVPYTS